MLLIIYVMNILAQFWLSQILSLLCEREWIKSHYNLSALRRGSIMHQEFFFTNISFRLVSQNATEVLIRYPQYAMCWNTIALYTQVECIGMKLVENIEYLYFPFEFGISYISCVYTQASCIFFNFQKQYHFQVLIRSAVVNNIISIQVHIRLDPLTHCTLSNDGSTTLKINRGEFIHSKSCIQLRYSTFIFEKETETRLWGIRSLQHDFHDISLRDIGVLVHLIPITDDYAANSPGFS